MSEIQPQDEVEIASAQTQRAAIEAAILQHLGENWERDWILVYKADDLVRLNKGEINLDFQADLLAQVEISEHPANPSQLNGRWIALLILGLSLFVALLIANIAGVFN